MPSGQRRQLHIARRRGDAQRRLPRATMRIVRENFALVVGVNSVGLILGAASGISVMMSALLHNMSTILVVANSLRLMFFPPTERREML